MWVVKYGGRSSTGIFSHLPAAMAFFLKAALFQAKLKSFDTTML